MLSNLSDVGVIKNKCHINVTSQEIKIIKENNNAMKLLDKFNEDHFEEELKKIHITFFILYKK